MFRLYRLILFTVISSSLFGRALSLEEAKVCNPEIKRLIECASGDEKEWVDLLLQYMPTIDLVTLNADSFLLDFKALQINLDSLPWTKVIPQELFQHFVLPYRVSQEPLEYFRFHYGRELFERVRDCSDLKSAVLSVNAWAYEQMKYEPTSRWDQSAGQTIRRGIGRCEEMAILFIKACRSVGIPTRMVSSPWWPFTNSNHAWVEVWTQDGWHYLGGAEMTALDNTWFRKAVRRTAIIKGVTWGEFTKSKKMVYYKGDEYTVLNLTSNYSDTTGLSITVMDTDGAPVESADVWISVFNYSSLRSVAHKYTDESGKTHFVVGKCDLFISSGEDSLWNFDILRFSDGNITSSLSLVLGITSIPDTSFWLRVKVKDDVPGDTTYKPPELSYALHDLHQERLTAVNPEILKELPDTSLEYRLLKNLNRSRGNRETLMNFWRKYEEEPELLLSLWDVMHTKDLVAVDSSTMQKIIDLSKDRREYFDNYEYPDSLFFKYVANPR
ncbi:transglutaminase domain-containing protein, partial [candidate division WOR-3 bacterium]|nr:transglutaminase domain-containing protein [candidate division WOR-3 bacterium]